MVLATMVGFILSYILVILLVFGIFFAAVSSLTSDKKTPVSSNSVLEINFDYPIPERTNANPLDGFNWSTMRASKHPGLNDILAALKKAADDKNIKGIYMNLSVIPAGIATLEEIRNALVDFKKSGKFIYTYAEDLRQGAYYLASVSDKIYLNPQGMVDFKGLHPELMFFKHSFEKLEIEPQVIRHGKYKSFIEPFVNDRMGPENREQMTVLLKSVWGHFKEKISGSRKISVSDLQKICDNFSSRTASTAFESCGFTYIHGWHAGCSQT